MDQMLLPEIERWITALDRYSLEQLQYKPLEGQWSVGQLYVHLVADTNFYFDQAEICLDNAAHQEETSTAFAQEIFERNSFPAVRIEGHPNNRFIPQPGSKGELADGLQKIIRRAQELLARYAVEHTTGKSLHPGFGYLNLPQWLQLAAMHFRHHLRQKQRLDALIGP